MLQKALLILLSAGLIGGPLFAAPARSIDPAATVQAIDPGATKLVGSDSGSGTDSAPDLAPRRDDADDIEPFDDVPYGERFLIGYTYYDYQHNGSIGKMIARDSYGGVQFIWMRGEDAQNRNRHVAYNYLHLPEDEGEGVLLADPEDPITVDNADRAGYCCLGVLPWGGEMDTENDIGVGFFHSVGYQGAPEDDYVATTQAVDFQRAFGAFVPFYPPSLRDIELIWPHGAVARNNKSHIASCQYHGDEGLLWHRLSYQSGTPDREDYLTWSWFEDPVCIDTSAVISQVVATSPTSDKVVLAWHHSRIGIPEGPWVENGGAYQRNSDIQYIVSEDGDEWDWDNDIHSITNILPVRPELWEDDREEAYGDTFRPFCDIDIQFDPWGNDDLYATFAAAGFYEFPRPEDGRVANVWMERSHLWFWSSREDTITMIADGWYLNRTDNPSFHSRCGGWRTNTDRGSIAFNPEDAGTVYVVWCLFPKIHDYDYEEEEWNWYEDAQDTSGLGYNSAEIMVSISTDYGVTWQEPHNITQTRWQGDDPPDVGECMSENWPSVAYVADDSLHIMYVLDGEAGGWPQEEGETTNCPILYHRIALEDLDHERDPVEMPREHFQFHNYLDFRPLIGEGRRVPGVPTPDDQVVAGAEVLPGGDQELTRVVLLYQLNGGEETLLIDMEQGEGDMWTGTIPEQEEGTEVWYQIQAFNDAGFNTIGPTGRCWSYVVRNEGELTIQDVQRHNRNWRTDYSPYMGYEVTVQGIVTTPATFNDEFDAYAIQDGEGGEWSGIFVRGIEAELNPGDVIQVTGTVMEQDENEPNKWAMATYIDLAEDGLEIIEEGGDRPEAMIVDLGDLVARELGEHLEGVFVHVQDFDIAFVNQGNVDLGYWPITNNTGDSWFTVIGLTEDVRKDLEIDEWVTGTSFTEVQGPLSESYGVYAIAPAMADDVGDLAVQEDGTPSPYHFTLDSPYPNPFNSMTNIGFELSREGWASLILYDLTGREVVTLANGDMTAGRYNFVLDASSLSAGVYIVHLDAGTRTASQKLVLIK